MEHPIDTLAENVIDKDQFTLRIDRAKARLADLDAKMAWQPADEDRGYIHLAIGRLTDMSRHYEVATGKAGLDHEA